ncbi:thioesterase family protein [Sphingomonas sp. G-3-2-10]|jgi:acyl-CoA thioester hydrolase|uniref:acyl-CoA thioesterase n=1 Tax=Sphingomonas sp. G-3-2-10 TaxID=2728838 RepID=UPI00146E2CA1|nr:thioesterase family protein [Sphingomonas sp. G-3-2-10]NML07080.1 acyl-CoA thioesterase [Sphingomonas sp. G-3-2-10]
MSAFSTQFRVRYAEIDGQKIVFNSRYLEYADVVLSEFWRWADLSEIGPDWLDAEFNIVRATIDYKKPFRLGDTVDGTAWVERVGNSSLTHLVELRSAKTGELHTSIEIISVHVDLEARKSAPIPQSVRERLEKLGRN